jgi:hypothetical protein
MRNIDNTGSDILLTSIGSLKRERVEDCLLMNKTPCRTQSLTAKHILLLDGMLLSNPIEGLKM